MTTSFDNRNQNSTPSFDHAHLYYNVTNSNLLKRANRHVKPP